VKNSLDSQDVGIDITTSDGQTPIMVAVDRQLLQMVVLLLTSRPDLEVQDNTSRGPGAAGPGADGAAACTRAAARSMIDADP